MLLAAPFLPAAFSPQPASEEFSQYRPAKDIDAFNNLLPPPIEFVEGSSTGALAAADGKYEPINRVKSANTESRDRKDANLSSPTHSPVLATPPKRVSLYPDAIDTTWPKSCNIGSGLYNTGNSCFLNSALQCLLHTPPLLRVLISHTADNCRVKSAFCMSCGLRGVLVQSHGGRGQLTPSAITNQLQTIAKHMRRGRQEDSHEFLRYAIDALQKSCLAGHPPKIDSKLAETTWVHKIFGGRLRSRVTCRECDHNSDTFDSILDLSLDIYGVNSLKDALWKFVAVDYLKGADKYKCEKCKKPVIAEKKFSIHEAPVVLTVHLKRFSPLGRKIGHHVHYDDRLSLHPFMSEGQYGPSYSLYGVICHAGGGPNSGHYFAHVKSRDARWYEMNDEMVSPSRGPPIGMKNAYVLFYIRDKGQALEAAINVLPVRPPTGKGLIAGMRKRKVVSSGDEDEGEDVGVKEAWPREGPSPPPPLSRALPDPEPKRQPSSLADPQAALINKKIKALASGGALESLNQYTDEDEEEPPIAKDPLQDSPASGMAAVANSSPLPALSATPSPVPSRTIPPPSFYGPREPNGVPKKRKTPDDEGDDNKSFKDFVRKPIPITSPPSERKKIHAGNPFSRLTGGNNLFASSSHVQKKFGKRNRLKARGI